jgi:hypothetical protein
MEAKKTAKVPTNIDERVPSPPEARRAPTIVIPDIALAPDIKGVCSVDGTLLISSKPKKIESTRTNKSKTSKAWDSI